MKKQYRFIGALLISFLLLWQAAVIPAFAEEGLPEGLTYSEQEILTTETTQNLEIYVLFDKTEGGEVPYVAFRNPDGDLLTEWDENTYVREAGEDYLSFEIPDAMAGTWTAVYDSRYEGKLRFSADTFGRVPDITKFEIGPVENDRISCVFAADVADSEAYTYTVALVTLKEDGRTDGYVSLDSRRVYGPEEKTVTVSLNGITSYEKYYLQLQIERDDYGVKVHNTRNAGPISYANPNTPAAMAGCDVTVDYDSQRILLDWGKYVPKLSYSAGSVEGYVAAVFADGKQEPLASEETESSETSASFLFDPASTQIAVELSYKSSRYGTSEKLRLSVDTAALAVSGAGEVKQNAASYPLNYTLTVPSAAMDIFVNGEDTGRMIVTENGSVSVSLKDGANEIEVRTYPAPFFTVIRKFVPAVDKLPPVLVLTEVQQTVRTKDGTFRLAGYTEIGATVTVNGEECVPDARGIFGADLTLNVGSNVFQVEAKDSAGNISSHSFEIIRLNAEGVDVTDPANETKEGKSFLPWIILGAFVLLVAAAAALIAWKVPAAGKFRAWGILSLCAGGLSAVTAAVLFVWKLILNGRINGEEFIQKAAESIDGAYTMLETVPMLSLWLKVSLAAAGVCAVIGAVLLLIGKIANRKKQ